MGGRSQDFGGKFQKVFRSSSIPFSITTVNEGQFVDVKAAFERRYGYSRGEVLGRPVHELRIWEDPSDRVRMTTQNDGNRIYRTGAPSSTNC